MSTVFVTGGAGFIGSHVCERLLGQGDSVICYDNFDPYYDPAAKRRHVASLSTNENFTLVEGDILDGERLTQTIRRFEVTRIVHLAARAGVRASLEQPTLYQQVNVCGTTNLLEAARLAGVGALVLASSSSVYGNSTRVPFREDDPVTSPVSPYAASKRAMELIASVYCHLYGMDILCHRFFTVYGPRQRPDMAISKFCRAISNGEPIVMYGDGSTQRDYTFVGDTVSGIVASLDCAEGLGFQTFNLGNSQTVTLSHLIATIGELLGRAPEIVRQPEQPGDVEITSADIQKAHTVFGYTPSTSIRTGIQHYLDWLQTAP